MLDHLQYFTVWQYTHLYHQTTKKNKEPNKQKMQKSNIMLIVNILCLFAYLI